MGAGIGVRVAWGGLRLGLGLRFRVRVRFSARVGVTARVSFRIGVRIRVGVRFRIKQNHGLIYLLVGFSESSCEDVVFLVLLVFVMVLVLAWGEGSEGDLMSLMTDNNKGHGRLSHGWG